MFNKQTLTMSLKIKVSKKVKNQCESTKLLKSQVEIMDETKTFQFYVKFPSCSIEKGNSLFLGIVINYWIGY